MAELDDRIVLDADRPLVADQAVIRPVGDVTVAAPGDNVERSNRILRSLSDLARTLLSAQPADLQSLVLDALFDHIPAERGFLMLFDADGELRPRVVKYRHPSKGDARITISKTIVERVVKDRVAILTSDARIDPRFAVASSVRSFSIRSAMCAPLWRGEDVIGIVHVDSPILAGAFTESDLEVLTAMANYAAIAIEQAALAERSRAEQVARARFEKYFSPAVATRILAEGERAVEELEATVLFADIVGFSRLSERMTPAEIVRLLDVYFSRMADVIFEHDGTIDKFIGDGIMAVFGAHYPQPDHAVRAVRVALAMLRGLATLNAERHPQPPIAIRVGINTGSVVAGPIGSSRRKEFTVLGDTVNVASRIESSVAGSGCIVVGERTAELARDAIAFKPLGRVALRGKDEAVNVYEVIGDIPGP
jgi:adenylate cyclase